MTCIHFFYIYPGESCRDRKLFFKVALAKAIHDQILVLKNQHPFLELSAKPKMCVENAIAKTNS